MTSNADSIPKAVRKVPVLPKVGYYRRHVPTCIQVPRRVEMVRGLAKDLRIVVHVPHIWDANRPFGDEHPFVPVVLHDTMCGSQRGNWSPAYKFFNHGTNIGQVWVVSEGRQTRAAYDGIKFCLCTRLCLRVCEHCKRPPSHHCRCGI